MNHELSRRIALRMTGGAALAAGGLALGGSPAVAGGVFQDVRAFGGTWNGSYDGREGRLKIVVLGQPPSTLYTLLITFTDVDRGSTYTGSIQNVPLTAHEVRDVTLTGPETLKWLGLYLHTWNTDYLTSNSQWSTDSYGAAWFRSTIAPPYIRPARQRTTYHDWFGKYTGHLDGRRARTEVFRFRDPHGTDMMRFELWDEERNLGWYREYKESDAPGMPVMCPLNTLHDGLLMYPINAPERLQILLYWHSWNVAYLSGQTYWNGQRYGVSFTRV